MQAKINTNIQTMNRLMAGKERLPTLNASINNGFNFGQNVILGSLQRNDNFSSNINIGGSFSIYNHGKIKKNVEKNRFSEEASKHAEENVKNNVVIQIIQGYLQILLNKEIFNIDGDAFSNAALLYKKAQITTSVGVSPKSIESEAFAELERKKQKKENASLEVDKAKMNLALLLQIEDYASFDVEGVVTVDNENIVEKSLDELINMSLENNPLIKSTMSKRNATEMETELLKTNLFPVISINAGLGTNYFNYLNSDYQNNESFFNQYKNNFGQQIALSVSFPIFNKGISKLQIEQSNLNKALLTNEYEMAKMQLKNNIQKAYMETIATKKSLDAAKSSEIATKEAMFYAEKSFQAGRISIYDLNIARNNESNALGSLSQAKYNFIFAQKLLLFLSGFHYNN